jgi:hypothetical protein
LLFLWISGILILAISSYEGWRIYYQHEHLATSDHLNIVILIVSVVALFIAGASYKDAQASGREQLEALRKAREAIIDKLPTINFPRATDKRSTPHATL